MGFGQAIWPGSANTSISAIVPADPNSGIRTLFTFIVGVVGNIGNAMLHTHVVNLLLSLPFIIPGWAIAIRRLHDIDRTGWWVLIGLIPFIGGILLVIWFATKGTDGPNRSGSDPLAANPFPNQQFDAPA